MSVSTERADTLVDASRLIAASRSTGEIITLATTALCDFTDALHAQFIDPTVPTTAPATGAVTHDVRGHGRTLGRFELVFPTDAADPSPEDHETIGLIAMVTGTALALAGTALAASAPAPDRRTTSRGDRRRMDRDFIDHTRNGQVGFIVLRLRCPLDESMSGEAVALAAATIIDEAIRQNDVTYVSGPSEVSILLPGATKPESAMAADRIRAHLMTAWGQRAPLELIGGVSAGRHEDPQRLAERALDALDEAATIGVNAIVTDLGT
ncbi:MAG: GGDEF domain-containing protein [Acidimicrobiales bacterium]